MRRVILHVGLQKTGTTSIQYWLRDHEALLAAHGLRFPRGWLHLNTHVELSLTLTRPDRMTQGRLRGDEWRDPDWCTDVLEQIVDDLERHADVCTILSNEDVSLFRYDEEFAALRGLLGDALIVIYHRTPADFLASLAAHYSKAGMAGLSPYPDAFNYCAPDSWLGRYDERIAPWRRHFSQVLVRDYDVLTARDGSVIPSFLRMCNLPVLDAQAYRLQRRCDPVPRLPGNRAFELPFGSSPFELFDGVVIAHARATTEGVRRAFLNQRIAADGVLVPRCATASSEHPRDEHCADRNADEAEKLE